MSNLLRIESHEISGGMDEPRQVRVVFRTGSGQLVREGTYDYPQELRLPVLQAHEYCIAKLIGTETFDRIESFYKVGETATGYRWTIFLKPEGN